MSKVENVKLEGRLEFDVIKDGKYVKRVGNGLLTEVENGRVTTYVKGGDKVTVFATTISLFHLIAQMDWDEEFKEFLAKAMEEEEDVN